MKGYFWFAILALSVMGAGCAGQASLTGVSGTSTPAATETATESVSTVAVATITSTASTVPSSTPTLPSSALPTSTLSAGLSPTELKYRLIAQFGSPFFCDPDFYPVARQISEEEFQQRFAEIQKNIEVYQTILLHLNIAGQPTLSPDQERLVYAEYKKLNSINLQLAGDLYQFSLRISTNQRSGFAVSGMIDANGNASAVQRQPTIVTCPICLAVNSLIATPNGEARVQDLQDGMSIWTTDASGARRMAVVLKTVRRDLPGTVALVHLRLVDGRDLIVSPGHPLTDGRFVGDLAIGDVVDGASVLGVDNVTYQDTATYDILPSGGTGFYWANGILLKSTLAP